MVLKPYSYTNEYNDTLRTDLKGEYNFDPQYMSGEKIVKVIAEDTDGVENGGEFDKTTRDATIKMPPWNSDGWFAGSVEETVDIVMTETKETENDEDK